MRIYNVESFTPKVNILLFVVEFETNHYKLFVLGQKKSVSPKMVILDYCR